LERESGVNAARRGNQSARRNQRHMFSGGYGSGTKLSARFWKKCLELAANHLKANRLGGSMI